MTKTITAMALLLGTAVAAAQTASSGTGNPVLRVIPQGADGGSFYYNVRCQDKGLASLVVKDATNETCVQAVNQPQQCKIGWRLRDAARAACGG